MVRNVVTPARISVRTEVWFSEGERAGRTWPVGLGLVLTLVRQQNLAKKIRVGVESSFSLSRAGTLNSLNSSNPRLSSLPALPFRGCMKNLIFQALAEAARNGESVALGIITGVKGSSPQKLGAKAIFHADRRIEGTLGGGCLEAEAQRLALHSLKTGQPAMFDLVLDHDFGWDDGLICGGKVLGVILPNAQSRGEQFWGELAERNATKAWGVKKDFTVVKLTNAPLPALSPSDGERVAKRRERCDWLYTETITPPCALWIAGSGHIAQAVAPLALQLDFAVTIFDDRPELANHQFFPREIAIRTGHWGELCEAPFPSVPTFGLIVT